MATNRFGLSRDIPAAIRREVRRRSKFGCVMCRSGIITYEHIKPFAEVEQHNPDDMCCLCGGCQNRTTVRQLSKESIRAAYDAVQRDDNVEPPRDCFDFHDGNAELAFAGLHYAPSVQTVFRVLGVDVFAVHPGRDGAPGAMSVTICDDNGVELFRIEESEWIGPMDRWDMVTVGPRIEIRNGPGSFALSLRHEAPGRLIVEHLDMRYGPAHLLATETTWAVSRYDVLMNGQMVWTTCEVALQSSSENSVAIDVGVPNPSSPYFWRATPPDGARMDFLGVSIGVGCSLGIGRVGVAACSLPKARALVLRNGKGVCDW